MTRSAWPAGASGIVNEFQVIAVDEASNHSPPATFTRDPR